MGGVTTMKHHLTGMDKNCRKCELVPLDIKKYGGDAWKGEKTNVMKLEWVT